MTRIRKSLMWASVALLVCSSAPQATTQGQTRAEATVEQHRAMVTQYCVTCHNATVKTAQLALDGVDMANVAASAEIWEKVARKLRTGTMPPGGAPRPDKARVAALVGYLETGLDQAAAAKPDPGRSGAHRLNRAEYANVIRDLFGLDINFATLLPADDSREGFDNIAEILTVSPSLLERYLTVARDVSRLALGYRADRASIATYNVPKLLDQNIRVSEELPFGTRGGTAIRHHFPVDGEYVVRVQLQRNIDREMVLGAQEHHQLDVRLDGAKIRQFEIGDKFQAKRGLYGYFSDVHEIDEYFLAADKSLEVRIPVKAGTRMVGIAFVKTPPTASERMWWPTRSLPDRYQLLELGDIEAPGVEQVTIDGPYRTSGPGETPSREKIFVCQPTAGNSASEEPCARRILSELARRAYRRPVTDQDVQVLMGFYRRGRSAGGDFEAGIEMGLQRMLVDPQFLFRIAREPATAAANTPYRISDIELASRLSFFLWSSIPDDELLGLAERDQLRNPAILEQQVRRMLADARAKSLINNFAGQWLYLRKLQEMLPDLEAFPEFDESLRQGFQQETNLFFESNLREDRPVVELLSADYTFVNERLARHYGIPNVYGSHFRRVRLDDPARRGLLGQGSVLWATSYPNRTSPVFRGKYVLDNLLGTPPPPPPPNVPALKDPVQDGRVLTARELLEQHRSNPVCMSCHARMDPLGFALEKFDALGRTRTTFADNTPIDTSGVLIDGTKLAGAQDLQTLLAGNPEQFAFNVTEKLMTYALGREVQYFDQPSVRTIVRSSAANEYRWSSLILGVIKSVPFQNRRR